jgi:O-antigen ligase
MKPSTTIEKSRDVYPIRWIYGGLITVALYFNTQLADPFNSPKSWILALSAAWLLGYVLTFRQIILSNKSIQNTFYLITAFIISCALATFFSDFKYVSIFGETQRKNGLITYLSLSIIMLAVVMFVRFFNIKKLFVSTYFIGSLTVIYALMQTTGNDFVRWTNPYNSIIGTVGNPNFAAAMMAIIAVICFSAVFVVRFNNAYRFYAALLVILLLFTIYKSNARQGLLSLILGFCVFMIIWIWSKNTKFGIASLFSLLLLTVIAALGMLQIGPLKEFLYKPSVSIRGYYWRAGIEMFTTHPFFGVGMDRYGSYFKEYREVNYPLNYGFDITSTNAHNTFIQFFATGGLFLGISYLALNAYILKCAISGLIKLAGDEKYMLAGIFSAWISYHAQSLISIDNVGISIWGWILGGSIVGLSISANDLKENKVLIFSRKKHTFEISRVISSGIAALLISVLVVFLYQGERNSFNSRISVNLQDSNIREYFRAAQFKTINARLNDPSYKLTAAANLLEAGYIDEGLIVANNLYIQDRRNLDTLTLFALMYERLNKINEAISNREEISKLDPWNAVNYFYLGKNYKLLGETKKATAMLNKILSFAPNAPIATEARIELGSQS